MKQKLVIANRLQGLRIASDVAISRNHETVY
jgi:hypothetical protein